MGAVAYDPKVITIWNGFRSWLRDNGLPFDYVLYSNYERQVDDLCAGAIHVAWNSPLAWVRAERLAPAQGRTVRPLVMRDTDRDLTSVVIVRGDSPVRTVAELTGHTVGVGAIDSPQATLIPRSWLRAQGVDVDSTEFRRHDIGVGLHGDHIGGERDAVRALLAGEVDAAAVVDANLLRFSTEGAIPSGSTRVLTRTERFDHCNMTVVNSAPAHLVEQFAKMLLSMSYADPVVRPLLDLEGLTAWKTGRATGYGQLIKAVDEAEFYSADGALLAEGYSP